MNTKVRNVWASPAARTQAPWRSTCGTGARDGVLLLRHRRRASRDIRVLAATRGRARQADRAPQLRQGLRSLASRSIAGRFLRLRCGGAQSKMKIKPLEAWIGDDAADQLRGDPCRRANRKGYVSTKPNITAVFPFIEDGIDKDGVMRILDDAGVGLLSTTSGGRALAATSASSSGRQSGSGWRTSPRALRARSRYREKVLKEAGQTVMPVTGTMQCGTGLHLVGGRDLAGAPRSP